MISAWHLIWIVPLVASIGYAMCALAVAAKDGKEE